MKNKLMVFVVALVFLFSFAACGAGGNALERQINELSAKVTEMENENKELKDKIVGLENENEIKEDLINKYGFSIPYSIAYSSDSFVVDNIEDGTLDVETAEIIRTKGELEDLCARNSFSVFQEELPSYNWTVCKKLRSYSEAFYAENALILCIISTEYSPIKYRLNRIKILNEELVVSVHTMLDVSGEGEHSVNTAGPKLSFLIEIKKEDVALISTAIIEQGL